MDYLTLSLAIIPICNVAIFVLLLIHVILSAKHNKRSEELKRQMLEQLKARQSPYSWKSTPTRNTPVPVNNEMV